MHFNSFAWFILITQILMIGFNKYVSNRNFRSNQIGKLPDTFKSFYSELDLQKNKEYTKETYKFGQISSVISLLLTGAFLFLGGFSYLDTVSRLFKLNEICTGLIFFTGMGLLSTIVSIPFSLYSTFVIEEKYGFNKTTLRTFFEDMIKSSALGIILGLPSLSLMLFLFKTYPTFGWFFAWIGYTVIHLGMIYIYPNVIMPWFNKFEPLEEGDIRTAITDYAKSVDFPLKDIYVMDGSKRSTRANAFFIGFGNNKRVVFYDTLLKLVTKEELLAVFAHEVGHFKNKHIVKRMIFDGITKLASFAFISYFLSSMGLYEAFEVIPSVYMGIIFTGLLYEPIEYLIDIYSTVSSRSDEYEADQYAVETTHEYQPLISSLKKMSQLNLSNINPDSLYVWLNYSHPTVPEREAAAIEHHERFDLRWQIEKYE